MEMSMEEEWVSFDSTCSEIETNSSATTLELVFPQPDRCSAPLRSCTTPTRTTASSLCCECGDCCRVSGLSHAQATAQIAVMSAHIDKLDSVMRHKDALILKLQKQVRDASDNEQWWSGEYGWEELIGDIVDNAVKFFYDLINMIKDLLSSSTHTSWSQND